MYKKLLLLIFILESQITAAKYKAVLFFHGINDTPNEMKFFADVILQLHPNTTIYQVDVLHGVTSFLPLWYQIDIYKQKAHEIMKKHPEGVHVIGYSQGGLVARGVIQASNDHNVDTFISVLAPHMGLFGAIKASTFSPFLDFIKNDIYRLLYTPLFQRISLFEVWRDTKHYDKYLAYNKFLPYLNNEVTHRCNKKFKRNFIKLKHVVLIGLSDDKVLNPWFTSQFGSLDANEKEIDMRHQKIYLEDSLGLRTLDERGAITLTTFHGVDHQRLQFSTTFIKTCVVPWLT